MRGLYSSTSRGNGVFVNRVHGHSSSTPQCRQIDLRNGDELCVMHVHVLARAILHELEIICCRLKTDEPLHIHIKF